MNWRLKQRYGFGAGRVALRAEAYALPRHPAGALQELGAVIEEFRSQPDDMRQLASFGLLASLVAVMVAGMAVIMARPDPDHSEIRLVMWQSLETPLPPPAFEATAPSPPKPLAPVEVAESKPPKIAPDVAWCRLRAPRTRCTFTWSMHQ